MGSGFARYIDETRLRRRERIPVNMVYPVSTKSETPSSEWHKISQFLGVRSHDVYGWSCGWRWGIDTRNPSFRIEVGRDLVALHLHTPQTGSHRQAYVDVHSTSDEAMVKVLMFIDQISEEIAEKVKFSNALPGLFTKVEEESARIRASKFPAWSSGIRERDELTDMLLKQYGDEHQALVEDASEKILGNLTAIAYVYGVRFMSISDQDLICFENARTLDGYYNKPIAWTMGDKLGMRCGNGPQAHVDLYNLLLKEHWGTYDLRGDHAVKVATHITLSDMRSNWVETIFDETGLSLESWLKNCGARPL